MRAGWLVAALAGTVGCAATLGQSGAPAQGGAAAQDQAQDAATGTAITIYSTAEPGAVPPELYRTGMPGYNPYQYQQQGVPGFAVVRQQRMLELEEGRSTVRFTDVAALIDPTTVRFESLTNPEGTQVVEQDYRFDLVSQQALLEQYIDQQIGVWQTKGDSVELVTGTLLSAQGGLILQTDDGLRSISSYSAIEYPSLPGGLLTRPTLVWDVFTQEGGEHETRVSYQTDGVTWWADYNVVFEEGGNANAGVLDVGAWVSIVNKSGASYDDARLKLVAGDVRRVQPDQMQYLGLQRGVAANEMAPAGFEEKAFFEYHLYTLGRPTDLKDNATKQIRLFDEATDVPAEKVLVYDGLGQQYWYGGGPLTDRGLGTQSNTKVDVYLRFENDEESGLGIPLPKGRIRVSKADPDDGTLEFIGEDVIDHTPKGEEVLIKLGNAFDVVGERTQTNFEIDSRRGWIEESYEIKVRNHKDEAVDVIIKENMFRWASWEILSASHEHEKQNSRTIHFPVTIQPDGEATVTYTVRYTW